MAAPDTRTDADTTALKKYFIIFLSSQMMMEGEQLPLFEFEIDFPTRADRDGTVIRRTL
jgi:hypothetical protein